MSQFYEGDYVVELRASHPWTHARVEAPMNLSLGRPEYFIRFTSGRTEWVYEGHLWRSSERAFCREQAAFLLGVYS